MDGMLVTELSVLKGTRDLKHRMSLCTSWRINRVAINLGLTIYTWEKLPREGSHYKCQYLLSNAAQAKPNLCCDAKRCGINGW